MLKKIRFYEAVFALSIMAASCAVSYAQSIPLNAEKNPFGTGWTCKRGFKNSNGECIVVQIPRNAELTVLGNGWTCKRGFRNTGSNGCTAVEIPANAELSLLGNGWTCKRGYRNSGGRCEIIDLPAHAELSILGTDWVCSYGFKKGGGGCLKMAASELAAVEKLRQDYLARRVKLYGSGDTYTSSKGAEFTVRVSDADLSCTEGYSNAYSNCEVEVNVRTTTDYNGNDSPIVRIRCEVEVSYTDETGWSSTNSEDGSKSVHVYGQEQSSRMEIDFSFSDEAVRVKLTEVRCRIQDVS